MSSQKNVIIIGPNSMGGITFVIKTHLINGIDNAEFMPSYVDGNLLNKIIHFNVFLIKFIFKLLFDKGKKIVHIHSASRGSFLRKFIVFNIAKLFGKKIIFHIHGAEFNIFYEKYPFFVKKAIEWVLNQSHAVLTLSISWKNEIQTKCSNNNIKVLYNTTTIKDLTLKKTDATNILFMGRLGKRKGTYDIIEAAKLITNDNIEIIIYGDGEINEIQNLINKNNLESKVKIGGWISGQDVETAYMKADIYILPSYNEGLPMSILEAMSYGLPIISTPVGGTPDAVQDGINGFLIEPGDYKALAEKIELLALNKELRNSMGEKSYEFARDKFDVNVIIPQLKKIYTDLLSTKG